MKRLCSIILVFALVLSAMSSISVTASAISSGTLNSDVSWVLGADGVLTISGNGAMPDFSEDEASPFGSISGIEKVVITEGVTTIGEYMFMGCSDIKNVSVPASVTNIGFAAFLGCSGLEEINADVNSNSFSSVDGVLFNKDKTTLVQFPADKAVTSYTIPEGVKHIADAAFAYSGNLQSVVFAGTVETMGFAACFGCQSLVSIELSNNLRYVSELAFYLCPSLSAVTIPNSVEFLGNSAFAECEGLVEVVLGKGVKEIGASAFVCCTNLESIALPQGIERIGEEAFSDCEKLSDISLPDNAVNIERKAFRNTEYYNNSDNWNNDVLYIGNHIISAKTALSGVFVIDEGIKTIASEAFVNCSELTSVTMPDSMESVGDKAFYNCYKLSDITLSKNITEIEGFAFCNCRNLKGIRIPDGVISIGESAFDGCKMLYSVVLPASLKIVEKNAFNGTENLKYIFFGGNEEAWRSVDVESNNTYFDNAVVHYNSEDHSYYTEVVAETCTDDGYIKTVCNVCGIEDIEYLPSLGGHSFFTQWIVDKEPTATSDGEKSHHCRVCGERADVTPIPYNATVNEIAFAETDGFNYDGEITYRVNLKAGVGVLGSIFSAVFDPDVVEPVDDKSGAVGVFDEDGNYIDNFSGLFMKGMKYGTEDTYIVAHTNTKEVTKKRDLGYVQFTFRVKDPDATETAVTIYCSEFTGTPEIASNEGAFVSNFINEIPSVTDVLTFEINSSGTGYVLTGCEKTFSEKVIIPETYKELPVTGIGADAFRDCTEITSIVIPDSVTSIGGSAFRNCKKLTSLKLSDNITSVSGAMCFGCESLENIIVPEGVKNIGGYAFSGCTSLKEAVLPNGDINIGANVFDGCSSLIIYCNENSNACEYADENNITAVAYSNNTSVDLMARIIYTDVTGGSLENILKPYGDASCTVNRAYAGTGSVVNVAKDGTAYSRYTIVVFGDTNGDSICDVLDCFEVERVSNGNGKLSGVYAEAGDVNRDEVINTTDYQAIVNKALAS